MLSIVIPVYRNEASIPALVAALGELADRIREIHDRALEAIFVVDGSPDASISELERTLPAAGCSSRLLLHSRNFGSFAAIRTGLRAASGEFVGVMAADGRLIGWRLKYGAGMRRMTELAGYSRVPARRYSEMPGEGARGFAGFFYWEDRHPLSLACDFVGVPYWALVGVTAALPAWRGWRWVRVWRRKGGGLCGFGGYDVRATPGRCPVWGESNQGGGVGGRLVERRVPGVFA